MVAERGIEAAATHDAHGEDTSESEEDDVEGDTWLDGSAITGNELSMCAPAAPCMQSGWQSVEGFPRTRMIAHREVEGCHAAVHDHYG